MKKSDWFVVTTFGGRLQEFVDVAGHKYREHAVGGDSLPVVSA